MSISMVLGASVLEHIAVWPHAFAAIPKSLSMFQGEYRFDPEPFWKSIHPTILILFIINLIICWKTERKKKCVNTTNRICINNNCYILIFCS